MKADSLVIHSENIGEVVGEFFGTPIRAWDSQATEERNARETRERINANKEEQ